MLGVPSFPAANSQQRQGSRKKIALKPGRSLMDWVRFANNSNNDIQGFSGRIKPVTTEELSKHCSVDDCWIAIRGRVYNVSSYMEYHPGGLDELMRGAGKDATTLFDEVHKWVNFDSMLAKCLVGPLKNKVTVASVKSENEKEKKKVSNDGFLVPTGPVANGFNEVIPRYDWYEKDDNIVLAIYTKTKLVTSADLIIDCTNGKILQLKILFAHKYFLMHLELYERITKVTVEKVIGNRVDILLKKENVSSKWSLLGKGLQGHNKLHVEKDRELTFHDCILKDKQTVTYDTHLYTFKLPDNVLYETPVGHHVVVKAVREGMEIGRSYTVVTPSLMQREVNDDEKGRNVYLMIKAYEQGALTPLVNQLHIGDHLSISDCTGTFQFNQLNGVKTVRLIAAGTGLTPMIRIISHLLYQAEADSVMNLLFANKEIRDILWKDQLNQIAAKHPSRFHVTYILSKPDDSWKGLKGRINDVILKQFLSEEHVSTNHITIPTIRHEQTAQAGGENLYLICGPDLFTKSMERMLHDQSIPRDTIHSFIG